MNSLLEQTDAQVQRLNSKMRVVEQRMVRAEPRLLHWSAPPLAAGCWLLAPGCWLTPVAPPSACRCRCAAAAATGRRFIPRDDCHPQGAAFMPFQSSLYQVQRQRMLLEQTTTNSPRFS